MSIRSISVSTGIFSLRAISRRQFQNGLSREMEVLFPASLMECLWTGEFGLRRALRSGVDRLNSMEQLLQQRELVQFSKMCAPKSSWTQGQCPLMTQSGAMTGTMVMASRVFRYILFTRLAASQVPDMKTRPLRRFAACAAIMLGIAAWPSTCEAQRQANDHNLRPIRHGLHFTHGFHVFRQDLHVFRKGVLLPSLYSSYPCSVPVTVRASLTAPIAASSVVNPAYPISTTPLV